MPPNAANAWQGYQEYYSIRGRLDGVVVTTLDIANRDGQGKGYAAASVAVDNLGDPDLADITESVPIYVTLDGVTEPTSNGGGDTDAKMIRVPYGESRIFDVKTHAVKIHCAQPNEYQVLAVR